jgi:hypothetical protein
MWRSTSLGRLGLSSWSIKGSQTLLAERRQSWNLRQCRKGAFSSMLLPLLIHHKQADSSSGNHHSVFTRASKIPLSIKDSIMLSNRIIQLYAHKRLVHSIRAIKVSEIANNSCKKMHHMIMNLQ